MQYLSNSPDQTQKIAAEFAKGLKGGEFVALIGDLGSGKTTFVRGLVDAFGGRVKVKSPTFTVMNEYPVSFGAIKRVVHLDFYRFTSPDELKALSLEDERRPDTVILAEWPDILKEQIMTSDYAIKFTHGGGDERRLVIQTFV